MKKMHIGPTKSCHSFAGLYFDSNIASVLTKCKIINKLIKLNLNKYWCIKRLKHETILKKFKKERDKPILGDLTSYKKIFKIQ